MAEYIERTPELILATNAGARAIENTKRFHGAIYTRDVFDPNKAEIAYLQAAKVLRDIEDIPAADVAPVVHGHWIWHEEEFKYECSACNCWFDYNHTFAIFDHDFEYSSYCPNCGAKMDGGAE